MLTTFGESHGVAVGGVLDGFPSRITIDIDFIQAELDRRKPGTSSFASPRGEEDRLEILSGVFEGLSTGAPIAFLVRNKDQRPDDYRNLKDVYRPSHADYTWEKKFGIRDYRGGGRSSARETVARVAGGAFAKLILKNHGIEVLAAIDEIAGFRFPEEAEKAYSFLEQLKTEGDTAGGIILCRVKGVPAGLGSPVFGKLQADLAGAMLGINAVKGFEYGSGFAGSRMKGSQHNDPFGLSGGVIRTLTNHSGGIQGGISNGEDIIFRVAFKPVATLRQEQQTVNRNGEPVRVEASGRHDVCVVPRALPIVEAMAALVIADHLLMFRAYPAP